MKKMLKLPSIKIEQNGITFFSCCINAKDLAKLCDTSVETFDTDDTIYQRKLNTRRVEKIERYLHSKKGILPTTIVLNAKQPLIYKDNFIYIDTENDHFFIIDGQHRIFGAASLEYDFLLNVVIMNNIDLDYQSELFLLINNEQKRVNSNVRFNMMAHDKVKTPEKIIWNISRYLNLDYSSPFYEMIRFDDNWSDNVNMKLSISTFAEPLVNLIYNSRDHYELKRKLEENNCYKKIDASIENMNEKYKNRIFWDFYINDREDLIYKFIYNYFYAISTIFNNAWKNPKYILCKTTGYSAISMLFKDVFKICSEGFDFSINHLLTLLKPLKVFERRLIIKEYGLGKIGSYELYKDFKKTLGIFEDDTDYSLLSIFDEDSENDEGI